MQLTHLLRMTAVSSTIHPSPSTMPPLSSSAMIVHLGCRMQPVLHVAIDQPCCHVALASRVDNAAPLPIVMLPRRSASWQMMARAPTLSLPVDVDAIRGQSQGVPTRSLADAMETKRVQQYGSICACVCAPVAVCPDRVHQSRVESE